MTKMTETKSAARTEANRSTVQKLTQAGHPFEFYICRDQKGLFSVGLKVWHANDTRRLDERCIYLAKFFTRADATAYPTQLTA